MIFNHGFKLQHLTMIETKKSKNSLKKIGKIKTIARCKICEVIRKKLRRKNLHEFQLSLGVKSVSTLSINFFWIYLSRGLFNSTKLP